MLNYEEIKTIVENHFIKHSNIERLNHSKRVVDMALKLNAIHNLHLDEELVKITAILHDYAKVYDEKLVDLVVKEYGNNHPLLKVKSIHHAMVGDTVIKEELRITNLELLDAVKYHSTGKPNMSSLCKIIFLADYIEMGRTFKEAEIIRNVAFANLDEAIVKMTKNSIDHIKSKGYAVYPLTFETYNYYKKENDLC